MPLLLLVFLLLGSASGAARDELDPALFRAWSRGAVNIMETYADYKDAFAEYRPKVYDSATDALADRKRALFLMIEFDVMAPGLGSAEKMNGVRINTTQGSMQAFIQKTYGTYHASWRGREHEFGGYAILDLMSASVFPEENPGHDSLFAGLSKNEAIGPDAGFVISAAYYRLRDIEINAGSLVRFVPLTERDFAGREVFTFRDDVAGIKTGSRSESGLFLDLRKGPYSFNSLYSVREQVEFLGLGAGAFEWRDVTIQPTLSYAKYRTRFQAGAEFGRRLTDRRTLAAELVGDVHRNSAGRIEAFHHALLGHTWTFFALPRARLNEFRRYDFRLLLDAEASMSSDAVDETVWGGSAHVSLVDMIGLFSLRLGFGYNDYRHLRLFPVRDIVNMDFMIRVAW